MKFKSAAMLFAVSFAVASVGLGGAWYAYKNAMIQRDIRWRVIHVEEALARLTAHTQRLAAAPQAAPSSAPVIEAAQLEAIAEMARQARDSALMARLAVTQNAAPAAAPAAPERAHCSVFVESLAASAPGRSPAYGAFVARFLAICAANRDATVFDAFERAIIPSP